MTDRARAAPTHMVTEPDADGLPVVRDFAARHGAGLGLGVSLGGGGLFFVAWQVSYLHELAERGVHLAGADRIVGTSAGSLVATVLEGGGLRRLHAELTVLGKVPKVLGALAPSGDLHPSQVRALTLFRDAADAAPATVIAIGHAGLAAQTPSASVMARNVGLVVASRRWPSPGLHITVTDAYTAQRCVITKAAQIAPARAVAASSAVPGLFAPQPVADRRCMDGGVSGSGTHLDLLAGAERVVVLALSDGSDIGPGMMTNAPGSAEAELVALRASGSAVFRRLPETIDTALLMDPTAVPDAVAMGRRQAEADTDELRAFLG